MPLRLSQEEVVSKMKEVRPEYDFSKFVYKNNHTKSIVICDKEHEFLVTSNQLISKKSRCPYCSGHKHTLNPVEKMKQMEPNYNFDRFIYINAHSKSIIQCSNNHTYKASFNSVQKGYRCPICRKSKSKPETEIIEFIKTIYNGIIEENNRKLIKNPRTKLYLELDIYLPEIGFAIEFNGKYWHSDERIKTFSSGQFNTAIEKHILKTILCRAKGVRLIHIDEVDYKSDKESCLNRIKEEILQIN